jgi:hypothetical protein
MPKEPWQGMKPMSRRTRAAYVEAMVRLGAEDPPLGRTDITRAIDDIEARVASATQGLDLPEPRGHWKTAGSLLAAAAVLRRLCSHRPSQPHSTAD